MSERDAVGRGLTAVLAIILGVMSIAALERKFSIGMLPELWSDDVLLYLTAIGIVVLFCVHMVAGKEQRMKSISPTALAASLVVLILAFYLIFDHLFDLEDGLRYRLYLLALVSFVVLSLVILVTWYRPQVGEER
jgi:hypothetical protein